MDIVFRFLFCPVRYFFFVRYLPITMSLQTQPLRFLGNRQHWCPNKIRKVYVAHRIEVEKLFVYADVPFISTATYFLVFLRSRMLCDLPSNSGNFLFVYRSCRFLTFLKILGNLNSANTTFDLNIVNFAI